MSGKCIITIP